MTIVLIILALTLLILSIFLLKELFKKFGFWKDFQRKYKNQISWKYDGDKKPGMYTIKIQGDSLFQVLIGFDFSLGPIKNIGYDVFGYMESDNNGTLYFSTYLGKGGVELIFLVEGIDTEDISVSCIDEMISIEPKYTFYPHWWQKIGLFG